MTNDIKGHFDFFLHAPLTDGWGVDLYFFSLAYLVWKSYCRSICYYTVYI